jgi:hypothetical protein
MSTPHELHSRQHAWIAGRNLERCRDWAVCPMCLAEMGNDHHILWQEGRDPLAGVETAQPWQPPKT